MPGSVEGAHPKESAGDATGVIIGVADLVGVTSQGYTGRARLFSHSLADGGHCRCGDG